MSSGGGDPWEPTSATTQPFEPVSTTTQPYEPVERVWRYPESATDSRRAWYGRPVWLLVVALLAGLAGGGIGGWIGSESGGGKGGTGSVITLPQTQTGKPGTNGNQITVVAAAVLPSVVSIDLTTPSEEGTGSGFVIQPSGYILTNNHVVAPVAEQGGSLTVTFNSGQQAKGRIVG